MPTPEVRDELCRAARLAVRESYSPYSGFRVGAAVYTERGVFTGCNIENASFGLTICAERCAVFRAISSGAREVSAVVIYTPTTKATAPCGACRQVLREFTKDASVTCICDTDDVLETSSADLLPWSFGPEAIEIPGRFEEMNRRPRMCVDIDNVLAQTDCVMRSIIVELTMGRVALEYADISRFNYWECMDQRGGHIGRDEWKAVHEAFSSPLRIASLTPVPGVQDALSRLSMRFDIHLATSRLPAARKTTIEWLERHRFPAHDLHFLKHGEKHMSLGKFDVSVEDDPAQSLAFALAGYGLNFLMAHPWNQDSPKHASILRVTSWSEILSVLNC